MTINISGVASSYNATADNFYDVPTNPRIFTAGFNFATGDKLFTIIYEDGSISNDTFQRPISSGNIHTEYTNLHATDGFSIRCFDSHTNTGLNLASINLANNDYFVLLHSDNMHLYHFAKITKVVNADAQGDKFEFSPRLGNEVAKGVKFKVFKGPSNTDKIVAISAGIDQQIGDTINNVVSMFNIARPFFYFYNDKLDKKNELNHNTKYMLRMGDTNSNVNSVTVNTHNHVFTTVADHRYKIIDYSKFTYNIKLEDKLKLLDDPDVGTSNESTLLSSTYNTTTNYNNCFVNARRDVNDDASSLDLTGPMRYVYYNFSPEDNNRMPNVYECNIADSFDAKAGYASLKLIDSTKNLSNKVFNNDRLFVNQKLSEENLNDWVEVGTINTLINAGTRTYSLEGTVERPNLYFSATNEIKIGDRICIVSGVASTHNISLETHSRLTTESIFTSATSLTSFSNGTKVYRKRLNSVDNTFITATNISGDKLEKLNAIILSNQYTNFYCRMGSFISNVNEEYGLLTLTFENNLMDSETALRYIFGEILLNYQVFFGEVENINKTLENQQTIFEVEGRNTLSKLVDIIINKNTLFSADYIKTAQSQYNDVVDVGVFATWARNVAGITFDSSVTIAAGTHLWNGFGYIGQIATGGTGTNFSLTQNPSFASGHNTGTNSNPSRQVYKETNRHYILGKALASNRYTASVKSLSATSDKGLFFNDGLEITGTNESNYAVLAKDTLIGESADTNPKAQGFNISKTESIADDLPFQCTLDSFDKNITNTLIDFTILEVSQDTTTKKVKLAPYMPLTLGRESENFSNFEGGQAIATVGSFGSYSSGVIVLQLGTTHATNISKLQIGDPLFSNGQFIARYIGDEISVVQAVNNFGNQIDNIKIYVDRAVSLTAGDSITCMIDFGNTIRPLHLVNGGHLHLNRTIDLLSPLQNTYSPRFYDYDLVYGVAPSADPKTYTYKYTHSPHRIFNLEKGLIGEKINTFCNFSPNLGNKQPFYAENSIFNYFADTYASNPLYNLNPISSLSELRQLPIGRRGNRPITHSNFVDKKFYLTHNNNRFLLPSNPHAEFATDFQPNGQSILANSLLIRDKLHQLDPKAARLFLYGNRDRTFYSSRRKDSLLNSNHDGLISSFGLMSINEPILANHSITKDNTFGNTSSIVNFDADYKHSNIISSSSELSSLKRFSLMRLTECVYDAFFNPINPEFDIPENNTVKSTRLNLFDIHTTATTLSAIPAASSQNITMSGTVNDVVLGDCIIDTATNKIIAQVAGISGSTIQCNTIRHTSINTSNNSNSNYTISSNVFSGFAYEVGDNLKFIKLADATNIFNIGGRTEDSILFPLTGTQTNNNDYDAPDFHLSKGLIVNVDAVDAWGDYYIDKTNPTVPTHMTNIRKGTVFDIQNIMLPFAFHGAHQNLPNPTATNEGFWTTVIPDSNNNGTMDSWTYNKASTKDIVDWDIMRFIDGLDFGSQGSKLDRQKIDTLKIVSLKTFGTEETGSDVDSHIVSPFLTYGSLGYVFRKTDADNSGRSVVYPMFGTTILCGTNTPSSEKSNVLGVYLGIKFHLILSSSQISNVTTEQGTNFKAYKLTMNDENRFLKMVDLTGCYLVPSGRGKKLVEGTTTTLGSSYGSRLTSSHNLMHLDNELIYVVSHEYDLTSTSGGERCTIITDKPLLADYEYKIMQPNPICFWNNTPKKIKLNTLTSNYTKRMENDDLITKPPTWNNYLSSAEGNSSKEAVQSMYVIADLDKLSGQDDLIVKTTAGLTTILSNLEGEFCVSDGDTHITCDVKGIDEGNNYGYYLEFAEMKKLNGVISISETFELIVNGEIDKDAKRAVIGTTVDICKEIEESIEEVLIENDINFALTKEDYKIFASPNFQGTNLFNLLNYLLKLKDKKMVNIEGQIKIINYDDSDFNAQYSFDDDDVTEIKTTKSNFNYFNEVIVYGRSHKAIRKDFRQIKKNGKKTLEIFEDKLGTKEDVEREAQEKLIMHTQLQELIECKIPVSKIKCLDVGEVIILQSQVAGIEPRPFMILEKIQSFGGLVQLKLGKYIKGIEDTIADLLLDNKQTKSYIRNANFNVNENAFDFFSDLKIKEMHLLIRKKESTGTNLGFRTTLNTNTTPMGFAAGTQTFTTLVEEDL